MKSAITNLGKQIANNQKEKLIEEGKNKLNNALEGLLNKNKQQDSITTGTTMPDSTKTTAPKPKEQVKEAAKGLLNDLLGGKKKKDTIK